jgi:hypothetical protein
MNLLREESELFNEYGAQLCILSEEILKATKPQMDAIESFGKSGEVTAQEWVVVRNLIMAGMQNYSPYVFGSYGSVLADEELAKRAFELGRNLRNATYDFCRDRRPRIGLTDQFCLWFFVEEGLGCELASLQIRKAMNQRKMLRVERAK